MEDSLMNDILPEHAAAIISSQAATNSSSIPSGSNAPLSSNQASTASSTTPASTSSSFTHKRSGKDRRMRLEKIGMYRVGKTLGHGNFAHVRTGYHEIANTKVAIKIVDTQTIDAENIAKINREIQILQRINHPYIVKLYEVIRTERYWYIITEYVGGGELFEMLTEKGKQPELEARRLFQQIVSAVAGCHGSGIVHRDIKAENLLLDKDNNAKLIDFGFSNFQKPNTLLATWCGSPPYAAPELLLGQEYDGTKSDVWSLGVILYILVTAGFPFPGDSVDKLKRAVLSEHLRIPFWVSVECADLIRKMLTVSPTKRYSLAQVSQHRWFTENISDTMRELVKSSLNNERRASPSPSLNLTVDRRMSAKILDPAVMIFMQQHTNWTEEQIVEDVLKQNFEGPIYATYELLNNKLAEYKDSAIQLERDEHPRRGSRGSILSGKANVEPDTPQTTIPAHHLAKLSLSTSQDYDSDDSSASDLTQNEESSSPRYRVGGAYSRRRMRRNLYQNIPEQQPSEQRRHTLCAADRLPLNPLISAPQLPMDSVALANAAALAMANFARLQQLQRQHQQLVQQHKLANTLTGNLPTLVNIPVSQERRASANEALLGLNSYAHLLAAACSTMGVPSATTTEVNSQSTSNPPAHHPTVEEEGQTYLNHYGLSKRNTLHAVAGMSSLSGIPSGSQQPRHSRTPYAKQNGNERRSSWASSSSNAAATGLLSQQQQAQLEKLYRQSIGGGGSPNNDALSGVQQLQREFQKLKACTQDQQPSQPASLQNRSFSMIPPSILEVNPPPTISITDEHNRCFPQASGPYDSMSFMSQNAQSSLTGQPRPATVIGLASTSSTASTPDSQPSSSSAMTINSTDKSNTAVKYFFIPVSLEVALERLPKFGDATENLIYEIAPDTDLTKNTAKVRFSHKNGVLFEMILHRMTQSPNISRTEFTLLNGDQTEYDALRTQLLAVFNEIC